MAYYRLFYHVVWTTKNRQAILTSAVEPIVYNFIRAKAIGLGGTVFSLNGVEDYVHMVASIPPKIAVATFIGQIKGVATAHFNQQYTDKAFYWQESYGVFSFDGKRLPNVIAYVERQKEHHAQNTIIPVLERVEGDSSQPMIREYQETYLVNDEAWHQEMMLWEM